MPDLDKKPWTDILPFLREALRFRPDVLYVMDVAYTGVLAGVLARALIRRSLITDTGCVGRAKTDADGAGSLACTAPRGAARFARVEVRRRSRFPSMLALSNPVWLDALA